MSKVYAVKAGRQTGVFYSWAECEAQVKGFSGAQFKSFISMDDANEYLGVSHVKQVAPSSNKNVNDVYVAYVDGSYTSRLFTYYGWSFVISNQEGKFVFETYGAQEGEAAEMRNVAGELAAVMRSVVWAKQNNSKVYIVYDYQGIEKWVTGDWKAKNDFTKAYVSFMKKHESFIYGFQHVKGHTGNVGNERADTLAKKALESL